MNTPIVLGVDPGAAGALAALDAATGALIWVEDMPTLDRAVQAPLVADLLAGEIIVAAWVEQLHGTAPMSASAAHRMGQAEGVVLGVLGALRAPLCQVRPTQWKKAQKVTKDKGSSRRRAIELWPAMSHLFARVRDDGRAESALIALHGWHERKATP